MKPWLSPERNPLTADIQSRRPPARPASSPLRDLTPAIHPLVAAVRRQAFTRGIALGILLGGIIVTLARAAFIYMRGVA